MKLHTFALLLVGAVVAATPSAALACGGCFSPPSENTQVSGHRMILSISQTQTTLWDQIQYVGSPSEFAWILPIHGTVDIGLSSDLLFGLLDSKTDPVVVSPPYPCQPQNCGAAFGGATGSAAATGTGGGVDVLAQAVVGPYETVQLHSTDPNALADWLAAHGYALPADVQPVVNAYVAEGFDFLALRLVPGESVSSMRPVRITTPGASLTLPLRMVAAGTGSIAAIKLWVFGEGRYEPANMPSFQIQPGLVTWDWATNSSNMSSLRQNGFDSTNHAAWLIESALPMAPYELPLVETATYSPALSGYGSDSLGTGAVEEAQADLDHLLGSLPHPFVTRLDAELARAALATDLNLGASASQGTISNVFYTTAQLNVPTCAPQPPCGDSSGSGFGGSGDGQGIGFAGSGCATNGGAATGGGGAIFLLGLAVAAARRRRARQRP